MVEDEEGRAGTFLRGQGITASRISPFVGPISDGTAVQRGRLTSETKGVIQLAFDGALRRGARRAETVDLLGAVLSRREPLVHEIFASLDRSIPATIDALNDFARNAEEESSAGSRS